MNLSLDVTILCIFVKSWHSTDLTIPSGSLLSEINVFGSLVTNYNSCWFWLLIHGPLTRYAKLRVVLAPGMWECRELFPCHALQRKPLDSDPDMHHGTCVTHGISNLQWWGKRSRNFRRMRNPPFTYLVTAHGLTSTVIYLNSHCPWMLLVIPALIQIFLLISVLAFEEVWSYRNR